MNLGYKLNRWDEEKMQELVFQEVDITHISAHSMEILIYNIILQVFIMVEYHIIKFLLEMLFRIQEV